MFSSEIGANALRIVKSINHAALIYSSLKPLIFGMIKQAAHNDNSQLLKNVFIRHMFISKIKLKMVN